MSRSPQNSGRELSRRAFVQQTSLAALATVSAGGLLGSTGCADDERSRDDDFARQEASATDTFVIAQTAQGQVRGMRDRGIAVFKGIPYGADTSGENRFMPPKPRAAWSGVRDALAFGPSTPQAVPGSTPTESAVTALIGQLNTQPESEDCLVLNVFTPAVGDGKLRPVMFWIHGGGFQSGSGSSPGYDGVNLATRGDVVVVTINHRLNVLGFLSLEKIGGTDYASTGNVGMLDIVAALGWVRDNIARFGGDPSTVTIFGESGGGRKVGTLLAMPSAKGLFSRAIIQSGPTTSVLRRSDAELAAQSVRDALNLPDADVKTLQQLPLAQLMTAYFAASSKNAFNHTTTGFAPVVDGAVLPTHPFEPEAAALMADVPVIAGTNRTELALQLAADATVFKLDDASLVTRTKATFGAQADALLEVYRKDAPNASPSELFLLMVSDRNYCAPMMKIAERRAALGKAPVYFYYFSWETPVRGGELHSPHALEISFVFDNTERSKNFTGGGPRAAALADKMSDAWIAFARTGNPNTAKLPTWTPYDGTRRPTMVFNDESKIVDDPNGPRREAMQKLLGLT